MTRTGHRDRRDVADVRRGRGGRPGRGPGHGRAGAAAAARAAWETAREVTARRPVYGRTTGVGANRNVGLAEDDLAEHGLRLLRSHAAGAGPCSLPIWAGPCW